MGSQGQGLAVFCAKFGIPKRFVDLLRAPLDVLSRGVSCPSCLRRWDGVPKDRPSWSASRCAASAARARGPPLTHSIVPVTHQPAGRESRGTRGGARQTFVHDQIEQPVLEIQVQHVHLEPSHLGPGYAVSGPHLLDDGTGVLPLSPSASSG